jgi:hypothetical protein
VEEGGRGREKNLRDSFKDLRYKPTLTALWANVKQSKICIIGAPEKEKEQGNFLKK